MFYLCHVFNFLTFFKFSFERFFTSMKRLATKLREFHVDAPWIMVLPTLYYATDTFIQVAQ